MFTVYQGIHIKSRVRIAISSLLENAYFRSHRMNDRIIVVSAVNVLKIKFEILWTYPTCPSGVKQLLFAPLASEITLFDTELARLVVTGDEGIVGAIEGSASRIKSVTFLPKTTLLIVYNAPGISCGKPIGLVSLFPRVMFTRYLPTVFNAPRVSDIRAIVLGCTCRCSVCWPHLGSYISVIFT